MCHGHAARDGAAYATDTLADALADDVCWTAHVRDRYGHTFSSVNFTGNFGALAQVVSDGAYHCRVFALSRYLARANVPAYVPLRPCSQADARGSLACPHPRMPGGRYAYKFVHHLSFSSPLFESAHFMELPFLWNKPCFVDCSYARPPAPSVPLTTLNHVHTVSLHTHTLSKLSCMRAHTNRGG